MMQDYHTFLERKSQIGSNDGFEPLWMPEFLKPFQRSLVDWAIRKGRSLIAADCGLGKGPMSLVWAENVVRQTNKPVLILTPLAVSHQLIREGDKFGIEAHRSADGKPQPNITVTNYERLDKFDPDDYSGVGCDECFPAGTLVDTPSGKCKIENLCVGDAIINVSGIDHVKATKKRPIDIAVFLRCGGRSITCSKNHPFFTVHGWRRACDLRPGDYLMETEAAMRLVWNDLPSQIRCEQNDAILRESLLSEMANEYSETQSEGSHSGRTKTSLENVVGYLSSRGNSWFGGNRVDSVEVLEQDDPRLAQYRNADGSLYFYDIEATQHPSFSVQGLLVHNSSIIKHWSGKTQKAVTRFLSKIKYRLFMTATPSPNDFIEMGTLSEALGELTYSDMLAVFFRQISDDEKRKRALPEDIINSKRLSWRVLQSFGQWALKPHAFEPFWKWVSCWTRACRKPSDLGNFDDSEFVLPPLIRRDHTVEPRKPPPGFLFTIPAFGLNQERAERRRTLSERSELVVELTKDSDCAIVWCHLNPEGDRLEKDIKGAIQVKGSQSMDEKEERILAFLNGQVRVLVTKEKIAGLGLNLQHCAHVVTFVTHSFERFYQSIRRCWRFGQKRPVTLDVIATEGEVNVRKNMDRKECNANLMFDSVIKHMNDTLSVVNDKSTKNIEIPTWLTQDGNGVK